MTGTIEYVYFAQAGQFRKIGRTNKPVMIRIREFQTGCPYEIFCNQYLKIYHMSNISHVVESVERFVQRLCANGHFRGEWYYTKAVDENIIPNFDAIRQRILERNENILDIKLLSDIEQSYASYWKGTIKGGVKEEIEKYARNYS